MKRERTAWQRIVDRMPVSRFDDDDIYIYAFLSPSDVIVYIGRTVHPPTRIGPHRVNSAWWTPDLEFSVIDVVKGWPAAVAAEARAIRSLEPVANITYNRRAG